MQYLQQVFNSVDSIPDVAILVCVCILAYKFVWELGEWLLVEQLGVETKFSRQKRKDNERVDHLKDEMGGMKNELDGMKKNQESFVGQLNKIEKMLINKDIEDKRSEILNFSGKVLNKQEFDKEAYDRILFDVFPKYEATIHENGLENGKVDASIKFLRKRYDMLLETGGFRNYGGDE